MIEVASLRKHFGEVRAIFPHAIGPAFAVNAAVAYALLVWRMRAARD